jgi:hypothetical protein
MIFVMFSSALDSSCGPEEEVIGFITKRELSRSSTCNHATKKRLGSARASRVGNGVIAVADLVLKPLIATSETDSAFESRSRYMSKRGFTVAEVEEAIRTSPWNLAELGRLDCRKDFPFGREWNGIVYTTKQVRPVFVEEAAVSQAEFTERSRR